MGRTRLSVPMYLLRCSSAARRVLAWGAGVLVLAGAVHTSVLAQRDACTDCDTTSVADLRRELERSRQDLDAAAKKLAVESEALEADSSRLRRDAMQRAQDELTRASVRYQTMVVRVMREESKRISREMKGMRFRTLQGTPAPQGWLGVSLSADFQEVQDGSKRVWKFRGYPVVEGVEPDSPAERAGMEAGDQVIAINGRSVETGIEPLTVVLRPGNRLPVRVLRDGQLRDITVLVEQRPAGFAAMMESPAAPEAPGAPSAPRAPSAPPAPSAPVAPMAPLPPLPPFDGDIGGVAGAELRRVGDLKDYFGVSDGVLVLHVAPETPAQRSGLRDGDVIVAAGGEAITSLRTLQRALERHADARRLPLKVVRKRARISVELAW